MIDEAMKNQRCCHCRFYHEEDDKQYCQNYGEEKRSWRMIDANPQLLPWWCPLDLQEAIRKSIVPNYSKKGGGGCHKGNDKVLPDNFGKSVRAEQKKMIPIKKAASMTGVSVYLYKKFRDQYIESH